MKTLLIIWLVVLFVGAVTVNRVRAWTTIHTPSTYLQDPQYGAELGSEPSHLQPAINVNGSR